MQELAGHSLSGATIVTGGAAGIGRAVAYRFAAAGKPVLIFDRDAKAADDCVSNMLNHGYQAASYVGSVSDENDVMKAFEFSAKRFGNVRALVNNAGISCNSPTLNLSLHEWHRTLDVNLTGVFLCAREAARYMGDSGGAIVNIGSMYGVVAAPNRLGYCATKSGVSMISKSLALEWADLCIRVNAVAPGYIRTALLDELIEDRRVDVAALKKRTPQGRLGSVEEVANLVYFLTSEEASYITGQVIGVDGGWSANGYL